MFNGLKLICSDTRSEHMKTQYFIIENVAHAVVVPQSAASHRSGPSISRTTS